MVRQLRKNEEIPWDLLLLADETTEAINRYINKCDIYVYECGYYLIATYAVQPVDQESLEIKNIAVADKYQRRGIGSLLLMDAAHRAKNKGFRRLIVGTGDASAGPLKFYLKAGFEKFDIRKDFFVRNYPEPIYENGVQLQDMILLKLEL